RQLHVERNGRDARPQPAVHGDDEGGRVLHRDADAVPRTQPEGPQGLADGTYLADELGVVHAQITIDEGGLPGKPGYQGVDDVADGPSVHEWSLNESRGDPA